MDVLKQYIHTARYEEDVREILDYFVLKRYLCKQNAGGKTSDYDSCMYLTTDYYYTIYESTGMLGKNKRIVNAPADSTNFL